MKIIISLLLLLMYCPGEESQIAESHTESSSPVRPESRKTVTFSDDVTVHILEDDKAAKYKDDQEEFQKFAEIVNNNDNPDNLSEVNLIFRHESYMALRWIYTNPHLYEAMNMYEFLQNGFLGISWDRTYYYQHHYPILRASLLHTFSTGAENSHAVSFLYKNAKVLFSKKGFTIDLTQINVTEIYSMLRASKQMDAPYEHELTDYQQFQNENNHFFLMIEVMTTLFYYIIYRNFARVANDIHKHAIECHQNPKIINLYTINIIVNHPVDGHGKSDKLTSNDLLYTIFSKHRQAVTNSAFERFAEHFDTPNLELALSQTAESEEALAPTHVIYRW